MKKSKKYKMSCHSSIAFLIYGVTLINKMPLMQIGLKRSSVSQIA